MAKVLIAGCGYVGTALGESLAQQGHQVLGLCRHVEAKPADLGIEWIAGDLTDAASLEELPKDVSHVVYAAAPGGGRDPDRYEKTYHLGLRNLVAAVDHAMLQRLVFVSSTGVFAQTEGIEVNEQSEAAATTASAQALIAAEEFLQQSKVPSVVLRLSGIYGSGRIRIIRSVRDQLPVKENLLDRYLNHIHRDDCVGAITHVLFVEQPEALYLASDHQPATRREMLEWLAALCEQAFPPLSSDTSAPIRGGTHKRVCSEKLRASGYVFKYPTYREGYSELLKEATDREC